MKNVIISIIVILTAVSVQPQGVPTPPPAPYMPIGGLCDMGSNAAATLLVPYFEVDSQNPSGMDTLVGIINLAPDPIVAHVVVWNVDAWSVFNFNIYLTGYDVTTFSMRQILVYGHFPNNGCTSYAYRFKTKYIDCDGDGRYFSQASTHDDGLISGGGSNWDIACYADADPATLADWKCKLSIGSYDGATDNYVGYITIDNTITCSGGMPDLDPQLYFAISYLDTNGDGTPDHGVLENSNVLMADVFYYDHDAVQADGIPAVHIEAFGEGNALSGHTWGSTPDEFAMRGINTFYYKYEWNTTLPPNDCREQLPLWWGFRYIGNASFDGGTWVDVWRSHNPIFEHYYVPGGPCTWNEIGAAYTTLYNPFTGELGLPSPSLIIYDEEEHTNQSNGGPCCPPAASGFYELMLSTRRTEVSTPYWPLVAESGWIAITFDTDQFWVNPGFGSAFDQSWVNVRYTALNKYSVGLSAISYLNGCILQHDDVNKVWIAAPTH